MISEVLVERSERPGALIERYSDLRFSRLLKDSENNKFGRPHGGNGDLADESAVQNVVLRHCRSIAGNRECLILGPSQQRAVAPLFSQEQADCILNALPEGLAIRFEYNPLRSLVDGPLKEDEKSPNAHMFPERIC